MAEQKTVPDEKLKGGEGEGSTPPKEPAGGAPPSSDDDVIPVRKSSLHNQQGYAMRKRQEAERLKSGIDTVPHGTKSDDDDDEKDEDELTPEARSGIAREVERHIAPIRDTLLNRADEEELQELFQNNPEAKEQERLIRKYMNYEDKNGNKPYANVPPEVIFHHIAFDKAETTGARRRKAADLDADQSRSGGHTRRPVPHDEGDVPTVEEQDAMDDKEFAELEHKVKIGKFVNR